MSKLFYALTAFGFTALLAAPASAQTRTWVSGVGDDVNPCSRTAPCKTFAGAISKTATGGEINCLDPGGFGAVTITKSITLYCEGAIGGVLAAGTNGITVNGAGAIVTIFGLDIQGTGALSGINIIQASKVHVKNTRIGGMGTGINFVPTSSAQLIVSDSLIAENGTASGGGINVLPPAGGAANVHLSRVRLEGNFIGVNVNGASSTTGINVNIQDSLITASVNNGISAFSPAGAAPIAMMIAGTLISGNLATGIAANGASASGAGSAIVRVGGSTISANIAGISGLGQGQVRSYGNNQVNGNGGSEVFSGSDLLK